jgi:hypothetical protein
MHSASSRRLEIVVRPARPEESASVFAFYKAKHDPSVLPRPEKDLRDAAAKGLFFIAHALRRPVAVAGVFDLGDIPFVELGGTFVDEPLRGFGLQRLLFRLRIAAVVVNQGPAVQMISAIDRLNTVSTNNALKSGFSAWTDPVPSVFEPCTSCNKRAAAVSANRRCCCDFYVLPFPNARTAVQGLLADTKSSNSIEYRNKAGDVLAVRIESNLLGSPRTTVLADFALGKNW